MMRLSKARALLRITRSRPTTTMVNRGAQSLCHALPGPNNLQRRSVCDTTAHDVEACREQHHDRATEAKALEGRPRLSPDPADM